MRVRTLVAMATLTLITSSLLAPASASAAYTGNLAGRPYTGNGSTGCQGTAYGRAGGQIVLFTAAHCRGASGSNVIGPTGTAIGFWSYTSAAWDHDLTYIVLYTGNYPSVLNRIFHGTGVSPGYWTITANPPRSVSCAGLADGSTPWGTNVYENNQATSTTNFIYNSGSITNFAAHPDSQHCVVNTNLYWNGSTYASSGSSVIMKGHTNTVFAVATNADSNYRLQVTPLYEGLSDLNAYWVAANGTGAWLCQTASC